MHADSGNIHHHGLSQRSLLIFILGIFLGYAVATLHVLISREDMTAKEQPQQVQLPIAKENPVAPPRTDALKKAASIGDAVVRVELRGAIEDKLIQALGIVTAQEYTLILPLPAVKNAREGSIINSRGHRFPLREIAGENIDYGIVAVKSQLSSGLTLPISVEQGALYLGREFTALGAGDETSGWVDSLSFAKPNGAAMYLVRLQRPMEWRGGAMIDKESKALIGIAMAVTNDPAVYEVIDTAALMDLMASIPGTTPLSLADYSKYYYEQIPSGMLERIQMLVNMEKWPDAIRVAGELLSREPGFKDRIYPHLEKAYLVLARMAMENNDTKNALALLDDAGQKLDESAQRLTLRAEIAERLGDLESARRYLHQVTELDTSLAATVLARIRRMVIAEINEHRQHSSSAAMTALLEQEIASDPAYAVYYYLLGKLFFNQGEYRDAIANLDYAIQLDTALADDLNPVIATARQRLNTRGLTEVPLHSSGSVFYVDVRLNGLPRSFRFVLDTGASFTALSNAVARSLGLVDTGSSPKIALNTASGLVHAPLMKLQSVELNGAIVENVDVIILETMDHFDGLIGLSYLNHFDIDINQGEQKLMLIRR